MTDRITPRQHAVLHVVEANGPVTPRDVGYSGFTASVEAARASLARLEARKLAALVAFDGEPIADDD